jgi:hypothetical protein
MFQKYITSNNVDGWIKNPSKERTSVSFIWKVVRKSFSVVGEGLSWMIGNDHRVRLGLDTWPRCHRQHLLPYHIIDTLRMRGVSMLNKIADPRKTTL